MSDINTTLQNIFAMKNAGRNPQQLLQMMMQQNPQMQQLMVTMQNMAKGKTPQEFFTQLAKQNGVNEQNMNMLKQMFGK